MSCGTRIDTHDRYDLAEALEREGEYSLAFLRSEAHRGRSGASGTHAALGL